MLEEFNKNHNLRSFTTFGIDSIAKWLIEVKDVATLQQVIRFCYEKQLPYLVLGKGSNTLFSDEGFNGLVVINRIDFIKQITPQTWHAGAGYSFSLLGTQTARNGLTGLEFASGIPGSVGGAVFMNAGANGSETCDTLLSVDFIDEKGNLETIEKNLLSFGYRYSSFQEKKGVIVGATFHLCNDPEARKNQLALLDYRKRTQPYKDKSAGCIFRNPPNHSAGALIEQCGLKGEMVGGAQVSCVHANFVINRDSASSENVLELIQKIRNRVKEQTGIELESEVRFVTNSDKLINKE